MKKNKSKIIIFLPVVSIAICAWILIIWVYPAYHTARFNLLMNKTIQTSSSWPVEKISSSDGKWILNVEYFGNKYDDNATRKLIISSVDIPSKDFLFSLTGDYYPMTSFFRNGFTNSWSPSGDAFFLSSYANKFCLAGNLVIFCEQNGKWNGPYSVDKSLIKESPYPLQNCYYMSWSEDGSKLALFTREGEYNSGRLHVLILDHKANLLQEFYIDVPGNRNGIDFLYWNDTDFLLLISDFYSQSEAADAERKVKASQLYSFSSLEPEKVIHLIDLPRVYQISGKDPDSNRILLSSNKMRGYGEYIVYDLHEKQIIKKQKFPAFFGEGVRTKDNKKIILDYYNRSEKFHFLSWNWSTLKFKGLDITARGGFFSGYSTMLNSFLYMEKDQKSGHYSLIGIKP